LIGIAVSGLSISTLDIKWIFKWFMRLCLSIYIMFIFGYLFRGGYTPAAGATPMLLSIAMSLLSALYFTTRSKKYLTYIILIFLVPVIDVTRMGILVMIVIFIFHYANEKVINKAKFCILGLIVLVIVFNTRKFQEKTFYNGSGKISDLSVNYYDNASVNNNGRIYWKKALDPGLINSPILGNGPRADLLVLNAISNGKMNEAHNDYLSVRYNYGYVGLTILLFGFLVTFILLLRISRKYYYHDYMWMLSTSMLTLMFGFLLFMYSDNILKYTIFFPNLFFAIIGIIYSLKKDVDLTL
jgi:hypothetical protein